MLRADPAIQRPGSQALCLVAGPDRGLSEAQVEHIKAWQLAGWKLHVLSSSQIKLAGAISWNLEQFADCAAHLVPTPHDTPWLIYSDKVRYALEELQRRLDFSVVIFAEEGAAGFRSFQAKRAGLAFANVVLLVTGRDVKTRAARWPSGPDALQLEYCERQCVLWKEAENSPLREKSGLAGIFSPQVPTPLEKGLKPLVSVAVPYFNLGPYLPEALESLARQTYPHVEVLVIDDGSTDPDSLAVFAEMKNRYPGFRFFRQENAGIGAARNRLLEEAQGEFFLPFDADNVASPEMIERFVTAARTTPGVAAWTCSFLAFTETKDLASSRFAYAYRPTGGCRVLAALRNVFGDGTALFDAKRLRSVGGFETERDSSWEDWEVFLKLVHSGLWVEVVPQPLFFYRHRPGGFSRVTQAYRNQRRVLRTFFRAESFLPAERETLWSALLGFHLELEKLQAENQDLKAQLAALRHRLAEHLHSWWARVRKISSRAWSR